MAPKLDIASSTHTLEEVRPIVSEYSPSLVVSSKQLFGGYSGSNYRIELEDGSTYVLKITNGYSAEHAELMCRTAYHLGTRGYDDCCLPILRSDARHDGFRFVSLKEKQRVPAFLLTFCLGTQADKVIRTSPTLACTVMRGIGGGLARMHASAAGTTREHALQPGSRLRWYESDGGCCDVQDQINGTILSKIDNCANDGFVPFYRKALVLLRNNMTLAKDMEMGITHGDPFADNVLVDDETGELVAFIDIEDVCVGPLLFDLACCAIGCCFDDSTHVDKQDLDMELFEALINGYCTHRKLPRVEREAFVSFMQLTLLCNCSWRFVKFNVDPTSSHNVPEEARNSYLELQRRFEYLDNSKVKDNINAVLHSHSL